MRKAVWYHGRVAAALVCITNLLSEAAQAYANVAPINVTVRGQKIVYDDFRALIKGVLTAHISQIAKNPAEMPPDAPLVYYAGDHIVWVSKTVHQDLGTFARVSPSAQPAEDAFLAATALAAMDTGTTGEPWRGLYSRTRATHRARLALGKAIVDAWKAASDQSAAFATAQIAWMQSYISVGTARSEVYARLKSRGLIPYNPAFQSLEPSQGCLPPFRDAASGTWPRQNESIPPSKGVCGNPNANSSPVPNPAALVYIVGAFGLGCDVATETTITFGADDRVSKVAVNTRLGGCI
jgi:hypothetical protein